MSTRPRRRRKAFTKSDKKQFSIAMQAVKLNEKKVSELKFHDFFRPAIPVSTAGDIRELTTIAQGDQGNQRDGSDVFCKTLFIRIEMENPDQGNAKGLRVIIFRWNRPTTPVIANILQSAVNAPYLQPISQVNSKWINILHDKSYSISAKDASGDLILKKLFINVNRKITWQPASINNESGNLYLLAVSNSALNDPTIGYVSRVRYLDN